MGRLRATRHCGECKYHSHFAKGYAHACSLAQYRIKSDDARTSPSWCPLGHFIPGVLYPSFVPGRDVEQVNSIHGPCSAGISR